MRAKLLIVDDDQSMRLLLAEYFRRLSYDVDECESGSEALACAKERAYGCFIFDVNMPEMDGLELLRRLREQGVETPAMFLTARDHVDDKVAGFRSGADDYLAKPFHPRELEMRVEALLRRPRGKSFREDGEQLVRVGDLAIDKRRHEVTVGGARAELTPLEFRILERLASEPGRVWSRNDLLDEVWSTDYEGYQRNIDPHINRLRLKIESDPKNPRYVLTVRGVGYKMNEMP